MAQLSPSKGRGGMLAQPLLHGVPLTGVPISSNDRIVHGSLHAMTLSGMVMLYREL